MRLQIIHDSNGEATGVFIPIEDWSNILKHYPNIENVQNELPNWQKKILDKRLSDLTQHPEMFSDVESLFHLLDKE